MSANLTGMYFQAYFKWLKKNNYVFTNTVVFINHYTGILQTATVLLIPLNHCLICARPASIVLFVFSSLLIGHLFPAFVYPITRKRLKNFIYTI
jgi:hypothetical protein